MAKIVRHRPEFSPRETLAAILRVEPEYLETPRESVDPAAPLEVRYSGVSHSKRDGGIYVARLQVDGQRREVGSSKNLHLAALKWNKAVIASGGGRRLHEVPCQTGGSVGERCNDCWSPCSCCCVC